MTGSEIPGRVGNLLALRGVRPPGPFKTLLKTHFGVPYMFGFGKKKQTVQDEHGQPPAGQESAKGGLFKRLFGARDDADLGWVPGLGPLAETAEGPPPAETPTAIPTPDAGATIARPAAQPEPLPEPAPSPVPMPHPDAPAAPVAESVPAPVAPTGEAAPAVPSAATPDPDPDQGGAGKSGFFHRLFHRDEAPAVPPGAPAPAGSAAPVPPAPAPRPLPKAIEVRDEPVDWESPEVRVGLFGRLRERLSRTRSSFGTGLGNLFLGRKKIDDELMEELETLLVTADLGMEATTRIITDLTRRVKRKALADPQALLAALKDELRLILTSAQAPVRQAAADRPQVILMVGVNGAGKTTTIGKLARYLLAEGNSVMLAAGDTFRAAAVEQLQTWGERNRVPVIAQKGGADSASVIFDALQAATARGIDVLIADTAGRLHTKSNLMDELAKIARVMKKIDPEAPHEVLLVIDATTGQNGLNQALQFHQAVPLTGIALTKLDGTAKGGIVFAIAERLKVPIRFIGVGERIEDLRPFDADEFLYALLGQQ